jgi:hypothetical protein
MFQSVPLLLLCSTLLSAAETDLFTAAIPKPNIQSIEKGFVRFDVGTSSDLGAPSLPMVGLKFLLPPAAILSTIKVEAIDTARSVMGGPFEVRPGYGSSTCACEASASASDSPVAPVLVDGKDMRIYGVDAWYPQVRLETRTGLGRQYKLVDVTLMPVAYNPVTRQLSQFSSGKIRVSFDVDPGVVPPGRNLTYEKNMLGGIDNDTAVLRMYEDGPFSGVRLLAKGTSRFQGVLPSRDGVILLQNQPNEFVQAVVRGLDGTTLYSGAVHGNVVRLDGHHGLAFHFVQISPRE